MTYISIYDRIKSLVDPFKKFKNTQTGQSSKSQPKGKYKYYPLYIMILDVKLNWMLNLVLLGEMRTSAKHYLHFVF